MQLDLNLLTALDALLEEESVGGAADRLKLSEPAMSRSLGRIRRVTGDPILIRTGRTMTPTPRALAMREEVRALVLRSHAVLAPETELHPGSLQRTFTLRCHDALLSALAPALVKRMQNEAPAVTLRLQGEVPVDTNDLARGAIDFEIASSAPTSTEVAHEHLADDDLVGLARAGNPIFGEGIDVGIHDFAESKHVVISRRGRLRDRVDEALEALGHTRAVLASVASTAAAIEIVRDTDAIVTVPSSLARRIAADGFQAFPLPVQLPAVPVVLSWHRRLDADLGHAWLRGIIRETVVAGLPQRSDPSGS